MSVRTISEAEVSEVVSERRHDGEINAITSK